MFIIKKNKKVNKIDSEKNVSNRSYRKVFNDSKLKEQINTRLK